MNGICFWRLKRHMTRTALAREVGCTGTTISSMEENMERVPSALLVRLADALGVTVDQLDMKYPEDSVFPGDHPAGKYTMSTERLNAIGRYCRARNISLDEYAALTGKRSRQSAQYVWVKPNPWPKEIEPLAQLEQISLEEFIARYGEEASE